MGLFFRPRRPIARLAASAATAGVAHYYGKTHLGQQCNQEAAAGNQVTQYLPQYPPRSAPPHAPSLAAQAPTAAGPERTMEDLDHLVELHTSEVLSDEEFSAAKARLLGL